MCIAGLKAPLPTATALFKTRISDKLLERKQVERVRALRTRRDAEAWKSALKQVEKSARSGENLMPRILAAVEASATVGEISDTIRKVFGEYKEAVVI